MSRDLIRITGAVLCGLLTACASEQSSTQGTLELPTGGEAIAKAPQQLPPLNALVMESIQAMPKGGKYSVSRTALNQLKQSIQHGSDAPIRVTPKLATPSFCSSATYLSFLYVIQELEKSGKIQLSAKSRAAYAKAGQPDGVGIWGRWNANGPGTAALFTELGCGTNFSSYDAALPGDFMKIWWTEEIGAKERGHSVVYLGELVDDGVESVRFWSSNIPDGYGEKVVPKSKVKRVLFSRLDKPSRIDSAVKLASKNQFLVDMLKKRFTWSEVVKQCSVKAKP